MNHLLPSIITKIYAKIPCGPIKTNIINTCYYIYFTNRSWKKIYRLVNQLTYAFGKKNKIDDDGEYFDYHWRQYYLKSEYYSWKRPHNIELFNFDDQSYSIIIKN